MKMQYRYGTFFHFGEILTIRNSDIFFGETHYQIVGSSVWIPASSLMPIDL